LCIFLLFTFFIWTQTWKIVVSTCASCAAILFIYVRSRSGPLICTKTGYRIYSIQKWSRKSPAATRSKGSKGPTFV
jgi:hypothetical protein